MHGSIREVERYGAEWFTPAGQRPEENVPSGSQTPNVVCVRPPALKVSEGYMLTSVARSTWRHLKRIKATLAFLLVAPVSAFAQTRADGKELYFLAETAADIHTGGSGLNLYALDSSHKLKLIREIVPVSDPTDPGDYGDGFYAVRDDMGGKIYVTYPSTIPSIASVIHKEQPALNDELDFNPEHLPVLTTDFGVAAGVGRQSYLLCTFLRQIPNYRGLTLVAYLPTSSASRVTRL
jgi:hypothetical protein